MTHALLSLAAVLAPSDPTIIQSIAAALETPAAYVSKHEATAERFPDLQNTDNEHLLPWIALADELKERNIAMELDWRTDREDLIWNLQQLAPYRQLSPNVRESIESLDMHDSQTVVWLRALAKVMEVDGFIVATMDIDSDSYVTLLLKKDVYFNAAERARQLGYRIDDIRVRDPNEFND